MSDGGMRCIGWLGGLSLHAQNPLDGLQCGSSDGSDSSDGLRPRVCVGAHTCVRECGRALACLYVAFLISRTRTEVQNYPNYPNHPTDSLLCGREGFLTFLKPSELSDEPHWTVERAITVMGGAR
jgi:hypothetical protein